MRFIRRALLGLLAIVVLAIAVSEVISRVKMARRYDIPPVALQLPTDSASLYRGRTLAESYGCTRCHGSSLGGEVMFSAYPLMRIVPPNLTRGRGGVGARYAAADWDRAIRHGIALDGHKLLVMPSNAFYPMIDRDVGQLIAYLESMPAVDNELPRSALWPVGRVVHAVNVPLVDADVIPHAVRPRDIQPSVTKEYGEYLATPCKACHSHNLGGGPNADPDSPPAPSLRVGTAVSRWTDAQFISTLRTGTTPDGRHLRAEYMPWPAFARMTDDELRAIRLYITSLTS